jgi:concanavalin A-like lectin/glucanase superfamily protein
MLLVVSQMACIALLGGAAEAAPLETIIYQDTFTVGGERQIGGSLNGTTIEGAMLDWIAPTGLVFDNIDGDDVVYAPSGQTSALINADLTPVGGIIQIEADVMPLGNSGNTDNWVAIGFQPGEASTGHGGADLWMLFRGNGGYQIFREGVSNLVSVDGPFPGYTTGDMAHMSITYDSSTKVATFAINDQVVHTQNLTGMPFVTNAKRPFIITYDGGQYFDNYIVSTEGGTLPVVTSLQSPAEGAFVSVTPELSWAILFPVDNGLSFDIYLDPNEIKVEGLDPSTLYASGQPGFTYIPDPALDYDTIYYWCVVTNVNGDPNQYTAVRSFKTDYEVPHWSDASWTSDADSTISAGKTYTHAVNLNGGIFGAVVVNGVQFTNPEGRTGANWLLDGAPNGTGGGAINIDGDSALLVSGFYYSEPASLTLTGLTPSQEYVLTFYTKGWGDAGIRFVRLATSDDGRTVEYDENIDGDGNGHIFSHTYTAPESGELVVDFEARVSANTWHHYAFSNEVDLPVYLDPSPVPGSQLSSELDLSWQLHGDVVNPSYNLLVGTDPNFIETPVVDESGLDVTTYPVSLDPHVNYYWKVEVVEDGGPVVYSSPTGDVDLTWNFLTTPPPDALKVLEWKMDETAGPLVVQTGSSEDADGILTGFNDPNASTMFVPGLVGNAIVLNGTSEYVNVSDAHPYMPTAYEQPFAVSAYFRTYSDYGPIFSMRHSVDDVPLIDITIGHDGARESPGKVRMLVRDNDGILSPEENSDSEILVNDGRWHSLVVMRASGNWKMYVDGVKRAEIMGVASGEVTLDWLAIGSELRWITPDPVTGLTWNPAASYVRYFTGMLDEVVIWDGVIRDHQIQEHAALVPTQGDLDYDQDTDLADLAMLTAAWLGDSLTPIQPTVVLEDMESYDPDDPNSYKMYWEAVAPSDIVGTSINTMQPDPNGINGQILKWDYSFDGKADVLERFWLRDRRFDLSVNDQISFRIKKLAGSTGDWFYFDFYDGRGMTEPALSDLIYRKGRIILPLADVPEDLWVTLTADIPDNFDAGSRTFEIHDLYQVTIGISRGSGTTGTLLLDEIQVTDSSVDCVLKVGELVPDLNDDCLVNLQDYAIQAQDWMSGN